MAKAKKRKGKTSLKKAKPARAGRAAGKAKKAAAPSTGSAVAAAANKRIATLEAENRRLHAEVSELRARLAERPAPAPAPGAGQAALEL